MIKNLLIQRPGLNAAQIAKISQVGQGSIDHHLFYLLKHREISVYTLRGHRKYYFPATFSE